MSEMKTLLWGIALIILVGIGGLVYRNAVSRPIAPAGACTLDAKVCPDGTAVGRVAPACDFAPCPPPNVSIAGLSFALPVAFDPTMPPEGALAAYAGTTSSASSSPDRIIIYSYDLGTTSAQQVMRATALGDASGAPVSPSAFSATTIGNHTYSFVVLGRFEGVVHTAYYLTLGTRLVRFDAITPNVTDWMDPNLKISSVIGDQALRVTLATLQTNQ